MECAEFMYGGIMKITAVIVAGGKGTRMGANKNKVFLELAGKEVIFHTMYAFERNDRIDEIVMVTGKMILLSVKIL